MKYEIELTLIRDCLGTNPMDPNVHDKHIIERQRKLISENSTVNKDINKYLGALQITDDKKDAEIEAIILKLEEMIGYELEPEQRELILAGKLEELKETFKELDMKGVTVFFYDYEKNLPMIGDHMIYGFMKASADAIARTLPKKNATILQSMAFTNSIINSHVRCREQFIHFDRDLKRLANGLPAYNQRSLRAKTAQGERITLAKSEVVPAGAKLKFTLNVLEDSPLELVHIKRIFDHGNYFGIGQWRNAGYGMFEATIKKLE